MTDQTKEAWTPGPWAVKANESSGFKSTSKIFSIYEAKNIDAAASGYVADVYAGCVGSQDVSPDEGAANAHLIAAAPSLYEALRQIVFDWDGEPEDMEEALAALSMARGES